MLPALTAAHLAFLMTVTTGVPPGRAAPPEPLSVEASHPFDPALRESWLALKDSGFALPPGASAAAILRAAEDLLGNRDPVLRDDVAYGLAVAWIYRERRVSADEVRGMAERLRANLAAGPPGDAVLRRSFSALVLSVIAAADLKSPVFDESGRAALVESAAAFLEREPDTRGYEPGLGWVHASAHAADLLKFLARSPGLPAAGQRRILQALLVRLDRSDTPFTWGEDARIAAALRSLVVRTDFERAPFETWLDALGPGWDALWKAPALDTRAFARLSNARHTLAALAVGLASSPDASPAVHALHARLLAIVNGLQ